MEAKQVHLGFECNCLTPPPSWEGCICSKNRSLRPGGGWQGRRQRDAIPRYDHQRRPAGVSALGHCIWRTGPEILDLSHSFFGANPSLSSGMGLESHQVMLIALVASKAMPLLEAALLTSFLMAPKRKILQLIPLAYLISAQHPHWPVSK